MMIQDALLMASAKLKQLNIEYPIMEAQILLAYVLDVDRLYLHVHGKNLLTAHQQQVSREPPQTTARALPQ